MKFRPTMLILVAGMIIVLFVIKSSITNKQVLKPKLIGIFVAIMALAITATGYLFNLIM